RTWINGTPTAHLIDDMTREGFIALQVHSIGKDKAPGTQVRWRNIRIKTTDLKPLAYDNIFVVNLLKNDVSAQERANGFKLLFDGKTTDSWRGAYKKEFPKNGWEIKDGVLSVQKSAGAESANGGDIVTQ